MSHGYEEEEVDYPIQNNQKILPIVRISDDNDVVHEKNYVECTALVNSDYEDRAARKIQSYFRKYLDRKADEKSEGTIIDGFTDEEYLSALIIQNHYRDYINTKRIKSEQENAARLIQHHYRQYLRKSEEEFEADLERAAKEAQENYSKLYMANSLIEQTHLVLEDDVRNQSATKIQKHYRQHLENKQRENAAIAIQRRYRHHLQKQEAMAANVKNEPVTKREIEYQHQFNKMESAAITIQRQYRNHLQNIQLRYGLKGQDSDNSKTVVAVCKPILNEDTALSDDEFLPEVAAITIQKHYKNHFLRRSSAATCIQQQFRSYRDSKKQDRAAKTIQRQYRKHLTQRHKAAGLIQRTYRAHRSDLLTTENAARVIQCQYRKHLQHMAKQQDEPHKPPTCEPNVHNEAIEQGRIHEQERATKIIQGHYRPHLVKNNTNTKNNSHNSNVMEGKYLNENKGNYVRKDRITLNGDRPKTVHAVNPKYVIKPIPKDVYPKTDVIVKVTRNATIKPKEDFEIEWPESRKNQLQKVKAAPKKKQVQTSLELKREQRRNDKNKRKDKFHLSKIKLGKNSKPSEDPEPKQNGSPKKVKKSDTPQIKQEQVSIEPGSEPELVILRESSEDDHSPVDILKVEVEEADSLASENEFLQQPTISAHVNNPNTMGSTNNLNFLPNRSQYNTLPANELYRGCYGAQPPTRRSSESALSSTAHRLTYQNKVSLGTLDSYSVQNMLKRNELLTRQRNDNHSYLHSYLKHMRVIKRSPAHAVKNTPAQQTKPYQEWERRSHPELMPGNLEKIARYGRNTRPEEWKSFIDDSYSGVTEQKGASRGSYYPVIPAYGKMKTNNKENGELSEIPWPSNIG